MYKKISISNIGLHGIALAMLAGVGLASSVQVASAAPVCHQQENRGMTCVKVRSPNSDDFVDKCTANIVNVPMTCPSVTEKVTLSLGGAAGVCNRNAADPTNIIRKGSSCNFDAPTPQRVCIDYGFDTVVSVSLGKYTSPKNNGLTRWTGSGWLAENARAAGNRRIESITCSRTRYFQL